jgi:2-isopropylmalate synthase
MPIMTIKMGGRSISDESLKRLTEASRFVYEAGNLMYNSHQPFVGASAFAHKAGLHVDALRKAEHAYEHMDPALVGNERRFLVSELSGRASMLAKVEKYEIATDNTLATKLLEEVQNLENEGYQFEAAEASFELLAKKAAGHFKAPFQPLTYHVSSIQQADGGLVTDAMVKIEVDGEVMHTAAEGDGPVNALDGAVRKALEPHFPALRGMTLSDYRVRVINARDATAAKVRVVIQSTDGKREWGTVGVHENIINASWQALMDSIQYRLLMTS